MENEENTNDKNTNDKKSMDNHSSNISSSSSQSMSSPTGRFSKIKRRGFSVVIGFLLLIYLFYYRHLHIEFNKNNGLHDILWLANLSVGIAALGMILQRPFIISTAVACVSFSHISWMFDVIYWLVFDTFQIGRALYLEEQEYDDIWWTTLHQFWFIPLCLLVLHVDYYSYGLPLKTWIYSTFIYAIMAIIAYNYYFIIIDLPKNKSRYHIFDLNTGHEFWLPSQKDAYNIVHLFDNSPPLVYVSWRILIEAGLLNGVCFIFLKMLSILLLEDLESKIGKKTTKN